MLLILAGGGANDPPNLRELSEKETLQVIDLVRKEFVVDDARTYVMGHSMGGAGTLYLAMKYPERWAAAAAIAPPAFSVDTGGLNKVPKMPFMIVHGDGDTVVPVTVGQACGRDEVPEHQSPVHRGGWGRSWQRDRIAPGGHLRVLRQAHPLTLRSGNRRRAVLTHALRFARDSVASTRRLVAEYPGDE